MAGDSRREEQEEEGGVRRVRGRMREEDMKGTKVRDTREGTKVRTRAGDSRREDTRDEVRRVRKSEGGRTRCKEEEHERGSARKEFGREKRERRPIFIDPLCILRTHVHIVAVDVRMWKAHLFYYILCVVFPQIIPG